ncbi:MAG: sulfur carrier protein ThiS [Terriglobales bacterium]
MVIIVNGEAQEIPQDTITVAELLVRNKVELPDMVSVQLNREFLDRQAYSSTRISPNDEVDFLYFMGGGAN